VKEGRHKYGGKPAKFGHGTREAGRASLLQDRRRTPVGVTQAETVQRIELMPNDIKLEGVKNYLSWSRRTLLILRTKDLDGCVLGKVSEPEDKASVEWKKWSITNSLVVAWLLNSLIPTIAASVDTLLKADEVRNTLSGPYSAKGNVIMV
jgi:hypothetical protein